METLSLKQKISHNTDLRNYIEQLVPVLGLKNKHGITLKHVCYIVSIENQDLYFDFPFEEDKENIINKFNRDLNDTNNKISHVTDEVLNIFSEANKKGIGGHIYYEYFYNSSIHQYEVFDMKSNLCTGDNENSLKDYLPIVHFAMRLSGSYMASVSYPCTRNENQEYFRLLTTFKEIARSEELVENEKGKGVGNIKSNSLACSFELKNDLNGDTDLIKKMSEAVNIVESYFKSPILNKILESKRKKAIATYEHTIYNLKYIDLLKRMGRMIVSMENKVLEKEFKLLRSNINALHLSCYNLIHAEQSPNIAYPFIGMRVSEIVNYFITEMNIYNKEFDLSELKLEYSEATDYIPDEERMFAIQTLIWNVFKNSCVHSKKFTPIKIIFSSEKTRFNVSIINYIEDIGEAKLNVIKAIKYLTGADMKYPFHVNERKPYRGLEIIRDTCSENKWEIKGELIEDSFYKNASLAIKFAL